MILVLRENCPDSELQRVLSCLHDQGLQERVIHSAGRTMLALQGDLANVDVSRLQEDSAVDLVVPTVPQPQRQDDDTQQRREISIGTVGATVGGRKLAIIAGPCSVEDEAQLLETAHAAKACGAVGLRGGAFKPRTNPYSFQGLGERALELLALAREQTGLAVVTEVMSTEQVDVVARYADVLQVGTRNMHNFNLLAAVGKYDKPVLLKRGWSATLAEFLHAAEYIINEGNPDVIFCERGIRTFETHVRSTLPLATVPVIRQRSPLPVMVDPSHGTGVRSLIEPMSKAAIAAGADGLLIEVHPQPDQALTDADQTIDLKQFQTLMSDLTRLATAVGRTL